MIKKLLAIATMCALSAALACGCTAPSASSEAASSEASSISEATSSESSAVAEESSEAAEVTDADGAQHLANLDGTYVPLFDVILLDEYHQDWIDAAEPIVGDQAEDIVAMLQASVTGSLTGQEAVDAYAADPDNMAFDCSFKQDVAKFVIDNGTITGLDADGAEIFSHEYSFIGYDEERGWYEYQTSDANAGEFEYFLFGFDEPELTYHIEFRYGSDLEQLENWMEGDYAYWMASGILEGNTEMAKQSIELFVTENLAEM